MSCLGQYSIQQEINLIAKHDGGKEWGKLIRDTKWREATRLKLRETGAQWCDYKAKECHCDEEYKPDSRRQGTTL